MLRDSNAFGSLAGTERVALGPSQACAFRRAGLRFGLLAQELASTSSNGDKVLKRGGYVCFSRRAIRHLGRNYSPAAR